MSARRICNAALPLRPLIHKTLLPTPIIPPLVCVLVCICAIVPDVSARARERGGDAGRDSAVVHGVSSPSNARSASLRDGFCWTLTSPKRSGRMLSLAFHY